MPGTQIFVGTLHATKSQFVAGLATIACCDFHCNAVVTLGTVLLIASKYIIELRLVTPATETLPPIAGSAATVTGFVYMGVK